MTIADNVPRELIDEGQALVKSLAARIHRNLPVHVDFDDLISYGQIGLAEAAQDFDAEQGTRFTTFAYYRIRGAILDGNVKRVLARHQGVAGYAGDPSVERALWTKAEALLPRAQIELGDNAAARKTLEEIVAKYPTSEAAGKARQRLTGR